MEKYITDERTGLKYELVGDYYLLAGDEKLEEREQAIGIWGQRHLRYLREHRKVLYESLFLSGKMSSYLTDIDRQAEEMFSMLVKEMTEKDGITESLKAENQMQWVQKMNAVQNAATEIVNNDLIFV